MSTLIGFRKSQQSNHYQEPWQQEYKQSTTILGSNTFLPIDFQKTQNTNTLVVGSSGTGKTYSFVEPNVLQGNMNYVISDAKGDILAHTGASLKAQGYKIQVLNLIDLKHSMTYNPLVYMNNQLDILSFAQQVISTDVSGNESRSKHDDPFWINSPASLLESLILFVKEFLPDSEQTMGTVTRLFECLDRPDDDVNDVLLSLGYEGKSIYKFAHLKDEDDYEIPVSLGERIFDWVQQHNPHSQALRVWNSIAGIKQAERTWAGVTGILGAALNPYMLSNVENLLNTNQIDFTQLLHKRTALFILYDVADPSKNFLSNVLYRQLFTFLYHQAFKCKNNRLPVKIRFFLDDFKNIEIPHFDDYLATARSRNISLCMMVQDESQLRTMFNENTPSIIGNCGTYLLTGTTDLSMAKLAAERFNQSIQDIRLMNENKFLIDVNGYLTLDSRYDYRQHPNYTNKRYDINQSYQTPNVCASWPCLIKIFQDLPSEYSDNLMENAAF
ncbi:VirD4-like conjugal transfer protein, CD1115 family [Limosilactobacillus avium]|uniref:VirD4-like conjugal transfer protein, CD1115 family n=1 Tax=Limosilactobacillus avium TaxID=2991831 RepID=UPI0024B90D29|nr:type IV secretory system conjugative DNA transfer family protein [Limosilactobacillus avium]